MSGEFDLIRDLFAEPARLDDEADASGHARLGIGDDASLHRWRKGLDLAVSVDAAVEGVHWPADFPPETAADKAVCAALSDLAAMGAKPLMCWISVMARDRTALAALARGAVAALRRHRVTLNGGDTSRAPVNALSLTVAGEVPAGDAMLRRNARAGQALWLVGKVGFHALGLRQWLAGRKKGYFVHYLHEVRPKIEAGMRLRELGVRCCIDVSDGLVQDAAHLAAASDVAIEIDVERLPGWDVLRARAGLEAALEAALGGGEDYALLFTADEGMGFLDGFAHCIGRVQEMAAVDAPENRVRVYLDGELLEGVFAGHDHFA